MCALISTKLIQLPSAYGTHRINQCVKFYLQYILSNNNSKTCIRICTFFYCTDKMFIICCKCGQYLFPFTFVISLIIRQSRALTMHPWCCFRLPCRRLLTFLRGTRHQCLKTNKKKVYFKNLKIFTINSNFVSQDNCLLEQFQVYETHHLNPYHLILFLSKPNSFYLFLIH